MEGSQNRDETVPYFDGIQVNSIVMDEKLDIKGDTVLNTAVALSTIFQKNDMIPDHIQFDSSYSISLIYGDITVQLGKDADLEEKMNRVIAILPKIQGKKVFFIWRVWLRSPIPLKKNWNRKKLLLRTGMAVMMKMAIIPETASMTRW